MSDGESRHEVRQIALEIYGGCNYECVMCPQATGRDRNFLKKIPLDVFAKVIDDGKRHGCTMVSLHGSGEATLHPDMPRFVRLVKDAGMRCITVTNGYRLDERLSRSLIEAGLDIIRVSGIGYDRESYRDWMKKDAFDLVRDNVRQYRKLNEAMGGKSSIRLYHLILDPKDMEREVSLYRQNWVEYCGTEAEIWMMHNWAGSYADMPYARQADASAAAGGRALPISTCAPAGLMVTRPQSCRAVLCWGATKPPCSAISIRSRSMRCSHRLPTRTCAGSMTPPISTPSTIARTAISSTTCLKAWSGRTFPARPMASRRCFRISTIGSGRRDGRRRVAYPVFHITFSRRRNAPGLSTNRRVAIFVAAATWRRLRAVIGGSSRACQ